MTPDDRGSILPLILGFVLLAALVVGGAVALGQAFVQQRDLQALCDGAAAAAAADSADLDRGRPIGGGGSLRFTDVARAVDAYLARDPSRQGVRVHTALSADDTRITLICEESSKLPFGRLLGHPRLHHRVTSTVRAAVS
jgi:uncharacterized membrane protein